MADRLTYPADQQRANGAGTKPYLPTNRTRVVVKTLMRPGDYRRELDVAKAVLSVVENLYGGTVRSHWIVPNSMEDSCGENLIIVDFLGSHNLWAASIATDSHHAMAGLHSVERLDYKN